MARLQVTEKLERLFADYYLDVRAYVQRRVPRDVVDDVITETFVVAWRKIDRIPKEPLPWLIAVARNTAATQRRGAVRRRLLVERLAENHRAAAAEISPAYPPSSPVLEALARLSDIDREAITLIAWDDLRPGEAAAALGQSAATFRVRLHRAKKRLRRELGDYLAIESSTPRAIAEDVTLKEGTHA
jgi:RNA polymerase sigma-70 factor (ECF subfamily)